MVHDARTLCHLNMCACCLQTFLEGGRGGGVGGGNHYYFGKYFMVLTPYMYVRSIRVLSV